MFWNPSERESFARALVEYMVSSEGKKHIRSLSVFVYQNHVVFFKLSF
jgi:hypothetical protein